MTLIELEDMLKRMREQGASDYTEVVVAGTVEVAYKEHVEVYESTIALRLSTEHSGRRIEITI